MLVDGKSAGTVLHPGTIVAGKYRVERTLAEGGMGLVVAATHLHLEQRVALKFLRGEVSSHSGEVSSHKWDALARFSREAKAVAQLRSEHVAHVLDAGVTEEGTPYMVMEYLEGSSLAGVLEAEGALAVAVAAEYAIQACEGLAEAHARGIVHRDIKPYNLFLTERSHGQRSLKIVDFGISKFASSDNVVTGVIVGSPCYMSPEQLRSTASVDHRSDIWSLGATLYELLAGHAAFDSSQTLPELVTAILDMPTPDLREARADVPEGLAAVVTRCLSKDREERFQSAGEVALALLAFAPTRAHVVAERAASMKPAFVLPPEEAQASPEPPSTARSLLPMSNEAEAPAEPQTSLGMATLIPNVNEAKQQEGASQPLSERRGDAADDLEIEAGMLRFRAPKWLGIAAFAAAVVVVFCTVLVAAPGRGAKLGATTAPAITHAETPLALPPAASLAPLEARLPELVALVVHATPPSAKVTIDGTPAPQNPFRASYPKGAEVHRIVATADGYAAKSQNVTLTSDVAVELNLDRSTASQPPPTPPPPPARRAVTSPALRPASIVKSPSVQTPVASMGGEVAVDSAGGRMPLRPIETKDPYRNSIEKRDPYGTP